MPTIPDDHNTPYGEMRGLYIHAHVVSQILSAAYQSRPFIIFLPQWGDLCWIIFWSSLEIMCLGLLRFISLKTINKKFNPKLMITTFSGGYCLLLYWACSKALVHGYWIPFFPPLTIIISFWVYALIRQDSKFKTNKKLVLSS